MVQIAIVTRNTIYLEIDGWEGTQKVVDSISDWDEVTEQEYKDLYEYFKSLPSTQKDYVVLKKLNFEKEKENLFTKVKEAKEVAKREMEKRRLAEEKRKQTAKANAEKKKRTLFAKLKKELEKE